MLRAPRRAPAVGAAVAAALSALAAALPGAAGARHAVPGAAAGARRAALGAAAGARHAPRRPAGANMLRVTVAGGPPGAVIPADFLGLSLETTALRDSAITTRAPTLANLLRGLGPGVLRLSGDSVDRTQWLAAPAPAAPWAIATVTPADLANLAALLQASGWRAILGLDLGHPEPVGAVEEARAAVAALGPALAGVSIGNEPDLYTHPNTPPFRALLGATPLRPRGWGQAAYQREVALLRAALTAAGVAAPLLGPDTARGVWLTSFAAAQSPAPAALTAHLYPLSRCHGGRLLARGGTVAGLLSRHTATREARLIGLLAAEASASGLPLRIDETNSVACAGQRRVSDSFAAALWTVDYALIAARKGVAGLNFHGGLGSCRQGGTLQAQWYSPICSPASGLLRARPQYYALALLRSLEGCAFLPLASRGAGDVSAYGLRAPDGSLRVVIDDMQTHAAPARAGRPMRPRPLRVTLHADASYRLATVVRLTAPAAPATAGVTLGGRGVGPDGVLAAPIAEAVHGAGADFALTLSPASVAVVTLSR